MVLGGLIVTMEGTVEETGEAEMDMDEAEGGGAADELAPLPGVAVGEIRIGAMALETGPEPGPVLGPVPAPAARFEERTTPPIPAAGVVDANAGVETAPVGVPF